MRNKSTVIVSNLANKSITNWVCQRQCAAPLMAGKWPDPPPSTPTALSPVRCSSITQSHPGARYLLPLLHTLEEHSPFPLHIHISRTCNIGKFCLSHKAEGWPVKDGYLLVDTAMLEKQRTYLSKKRYYRR